MNSTYIPASLRRLVYERSQNCCNKYKGSDVASVHPETEKITRLYHPRRDRWSDHFQLQNGEIVSLTSVGLVTTRLLQLNRSDRVEERQLLIELGIVRSLN